ncbi:Intracellular distribution of mitochondria [Umbelopsis sp. WA50703]
MSEKAFDTVEKAETQPGASEPVEVENAVNAEDQQDLVAEETYQLTVLLPRESGQIQVLASPREAIHDIKQSIIESPETCIYSCFYLTFNGNKLNEFQELGEVEGITTESQLQLIEDKYTDRDARIHINRLRDLLAGPYKPDPSDVGIDGGLSVLTAVTGTIDEEIIPASEKKEEQELFSDAPIPETAFTNYDFNAKSQLSSFIPTTFQRTAPQCLKSFGLSGWNPVPHPQKLKGDLLYLVVTTLENETVHITSNSSGFFVSNSSNNKFDPTIKRSTSTEKVFESHSLITLLQHVSPLFASNFEKLQHFITDHHMLEVLPVNTTTQAYPWAVKPYPHTFDLARPADALLNFGTDSVDSLRDWNDELQSHRELPRTNLQERVLRERLINKLQAEFTEAAVKGAMSVVEGSIVPLNPLEPEGSHMFVYNNIFFSKGSDGRGTFESLGGDEAAHVATGKDLEGVRILNNADVEGLCTLGSVIVDYKGERIVAQSIVPGIFRRQDENSIVYGSVDNGEKISADEKFHELLGVAAKTLHLASHTVVDAENNEVDLYTSLETKGLFGADGRRYILDLYRLNPVDIEFQEKETNQQTDGQSNLPPYPHKMTLLRPELMSLYWEQKLREWIKEKSPKAAETVEAQNGEVNDVAATTEATADNETTGKKETNVATVKTEDKEDEVKLDLNEFQLAFNPDAFTSVKTKSESISQQEDDVRGASKFLTESVIPSLVLDFSSYAISPLDGDSLTKTMHQRGINMRYLGKIVELVELSKDNRLGHVRVIAVQEMITRASKRILRNLLSDCSMCDVAACVSHFLNCLFGAKFNPKPQAVVASGGTPAYAKLTPGSLLKQIQEEVQKRFRYNLANDFVENIKILPSLREICIRSGIQLVAKEYHFAPYNEEELAKFAAEDAAFEKAQSQAAAKNNKHKKGDKKSTKLEKIVRQPTVFVPEDILNLKPTVKQASVRSIFAEEAFEAGKMSLSQGHRQLGLELLLESLALHEQTYGFLHPETSKCYAALAMIYYHSEDSEAALDFQRKAVISAERTCGIDHPETLHTYLNLGLFEHAAGRTKLALRYLRHALYYWHLIFGAGHPDSATADNNIGVMLQSLRDYPNSAKCFERACETQESILGKDHVLTGTGYHVLAKAYTLQGEFDKALKAERVAHSIFDSKLGPEDPRTKESDLWLKELTSNAVLSAKQAEAEKAKLAQKASASSGKIQPSKTTSVPTGELPIDQLVQYINEDTKKPASKKTKGKKRQ